MEDLRQYAVFAETVSAGSMSAAAKRLRMTPSAVSQTIRALEARTGVVLLHRSTRKLALTEAGERCLPYCKRLLEARNGATASLEQARDAPTGELRVAAPIGFAAHISTALAPVLADWPGLRLKLILDDRLVDLIDVRVDLAVRVGGLPDTNWIGRKLCDFEGILCASPAYLGRRGSPATPADLPGHHWLAMEGDTDLTGRGNGEPGPETALELTDGKGRRERVPLAIRIGTTSQVALQQLCEEGMGLASLFHPDARPALEQGRLVRLLPDWRLPSAPVTMVMPKGGGGVAKVGVAADALQRYFAALSIAG
ncbi:LysR family transcriptional regulator [uncultured Sphingomonas sp.]|uniref:LysR family transcriptional regulator n=1 Tax=uncultured Sphingomonas sp. TaxID=158754 RepID=UPI0035CC4472